ncbi:MAG: flagellar hook basal-body protein [Nitrospirae bacterium]|nr:flagellar hook basal-body protein [Nitrospirota bacterium]
MSKGIYIALSGGVGRYDLIDTITQNLANANTVGYKQDRLSFKDYLASQIANEPAEANNSAVLSAVSGVRVDFSEGTLLRTGNPLDIALSGNGFISLEGDRYTRKGDMKIDSEGYLVTHDNIKVMGEAGPIQIPKGKIEISPGGDVSVNGAKIDTLKVVEFPDMQKLTKAGSGIFLTNEKGKASTATVEQGYIEASNVNVVKEMALMITALREFEAFQKAIQSFDETTTKAINEMGRV